jgi:hypothetical protein
MGAQRDESHFKRICLILWSERSIYDVAYPARGELVWSTLRFEITI